MQKVKGDWSAEEVSRLRELHGQGLRLPAISDALGRELNATRKKCTREGLRFGRPPPPVPKAPKVPAAPFVPASPESLALPDSLSVTLAELSRDGCKFPIGQRDGEHTFCGLPRTDHRYCAHHLALACIPPATNTRDLARSVRNL